MQALYLLKTYHKIIIPLPVLLLPVIIAYAPEQRNISAEIWRIIITLRHSPDIDRLDYRSTSMGFILIPNFSSPHSVAAW